MIPSLRSRLIALTRSFMKLIITKRLSVVLAYLHPIMIKLTRSRSPNFLWCSLIIWSAKIVLFSTDNILVRKIGTSDECYFSCLYIRRTTSSIPIFTTSSVALDLVYAIMSGYAYRNLMIFKISSFSEKTHNQG